MCPPFKKQRPRCDWDLRKKETIYMHKAPMPYPHLGPCTSRGMSKTIAPPRGPTWKHCLGPQVSPQPCYHNRSTPESGSCVGGWWEVNIGWYWNREPFLG